jgi:DNA-binding response OmpR family regulator
MTATAHILLVEDDTDLRDGLSFALKREGYRVSIAKTVKEAKDRLAESGPDLAILDVMLPDGSGFDLCEQIRTEDSYREHRELPIIFLTARDEEIDIVRGLDAGADDYVPKPFHLGELLSRVRARLRRSSRSEEQTEGLRIDTHGMRVLRNGVPVALTASEYRLLAALMSHPGQVLSRDQLAERLTGIEDAAVEENTVSVHIRRLREKVEENPSDPRYIHTARGLGYRYSPSKDDE